METEDINNLIVHRINKAKETILDAKIAIENDRIRNAFNRIYYANFYAVSALSLKYGFSTSKHKQLMGWFNKTFVKDGIIPVNIWDIYKKSYDNRQESDYEDFIEYKKEEAEKRYNDMLLFVSEIEKLINN